jgi:hypothetical protein
MEKEIDVREDKNDVTDPQQQAQQFAGPGSLLYKSTRQCK